MKFGTREEWDKRPEKLIWKNNCNFCNTEKISDYILWEWSFWNVIVNKNPYTWDARHIMAVPIEHLELWTEIPGEAWAEMLDVHRFVKKYFWEDDYFSFTRETFSNRSLKHYHTHFLPWKMSQQPIIDQLKEQGII